MKENKRKCVKCGASPADDPDTKLFRFPKPGSTNALRCELWAKYCFPDMPWSSGDFQSKLHSEHRMLCHRHFKESAFVDYPSKKLRRFASPDAEEVTLPNLEFQNREAIAGPSREPLSELSNKPTIPGCSGLCPKSAENNLKEKEKYAFEKCKEYLEKISKLQRSVRYRKKKDVLQKLSKSKTLSALTNKISPTFALLLQGQIQNYKKKPKGRRWSTEEKVTALRLYKRSPTCYRLLRRMFTLPAPTSLKALLNRCGLKVGINEHIFKIIGKFAVAQKSNNEFILMFDEMAIKKHINYNPKLDIIEGFQDHGLQGRTAQPASHALVFMVAGIRKKIKQPVAYYLSGSSVTADRLAILIKEVLGQCYQHGINVAATVCDMDGVNRRALNILGATVDRPHFKSSGHEVVALFDAPHLIKCFRNLFLKYDIEWETNISSDGRVGKGIAKWSHIVQYYELDNANPNYAFAPRLKQEHLNPNTKQKMKVKLAVQVLSHTVSTGMYARIGKGLPAEAIVTADMISEMDKIFDTLNSDTPDLRRGKPFSTNLTESSPHFQFIRKIKMKIQSMKFVGATRTPPSQEGWLWTLNAVESLWGYLRQRNPSIKSLATRRLQQDPLENLFGCIRANCGANCNPTTGQFVGALKTALLTKISHICVGNCEGDNNEVIINNFKLLITQSIRDTSESSDVGTLATSSVFDFSDINNDLLEDSSEMQACAYVCGFIIKRYKNTCKTCMDNLSTEDYSSIHKFVEYKEYSDFKRSLFYPTKSFVICVELCTTLINSYLSQTVHNNNKIKENISKIVKDKANFEFLNNCLEHKEQNITFIVENVFYIVVKRFCIIRNRSFAQEYTKSALKRKIDILTHK